MVRLQPSSLPHRAAVLALVGLAALRLSLPAFAQTAAPPADVGLGPVQQRSLADIPGRKACVERSQVASFTLGSSRYGIRYAICQNLADGGKIMPSEGYIGMPFPGNANWYHSGFLFIVLNDQDIGARTPLSSITVAERGDRAILDMVWHDLLADVRVRFLGLPQHDHLDCEIALDAKAPIRSIDLRLVCYPSYFTAHHHRDGARRIRTPATLVEQGKRVALSPKENWWAVYYDEIFDVAKGEGDGPCAMLLTPEEPAELAIDPGSYAVTTRIRYPAATRRMHLAFWDFQGKKNAEAIARLESGAQQVRQELGQLDFTPVSIRGIDLASLRADAERAMRSEAVRAALGAKTEEIQAWLDRSVETKPGKAGQPAGIQAQEGLLQSLQKYDEFSWEVKLAELLSRL